MLNSQFEPVRQIDLTGQLTPDSKAFERIRVLPDLRSILLALDHIACVDPSGGELWRFDHPPWPRFVGGDALVVGESLVAVIPTRAARRGAAQVPGARLAILDLAHGSKTKLLELSADEDDPEGFHAIGRPDHMGGAFDGGYGQDGSEIWRVGLSSGSRIEVKKMDTVDRVLADISPSGDELLTTPHTTEHLAVFRWNDLKEVARLSRTEVFQMESDKNDLTADRFDFNAWFLGANRILARTRQGRLLVIDRAAMKVMHQLVVPGFEIYGYDASARRVEDPARALDFEGEINDVIVVDATRIVVTGRDCRVVLCEL